MPAFTGKALPGKLKPESSENQNNSSRLYLLIVLSKVDIISAKIQLVELLNMLL